MKFQYLLCLLMSFTISNSFAQIVNYPSNDALNGYSFANIYNNNGNFSKSKKSLTSNNLYIGGTTITNNLSSLTFTKTNAKGDVLFTKRYNSIVTNHPTDFRGFIQLPNDDFMILGRIDAPTDSLFLMRVNQNGQVLWSKNYTFNSIRVIGSFFIQLNNPNEFVFGSWRYGDDIALIKVDINGTVLNSTRIGNSSDDQIAKIIPSGNGCVIVGETSQGPRLDGFFVHLDDNLNIITKKLIRTNLPTTNQVFDAIKDVKILDNGNYLIAGATENITTTIFNDFDSFIAEYDINNTTINARVFSAAQTTDYIWNISILNDGYIFRGAEYLNGGSTFLDDFYLKTDKNFNLKWAKRIDIPNLIVTSIEPDYSDKVGITGFTSGSNIHPVLMQMADDFDDCISHDFSLNSTYNRIFDVYDWATTIQPLPIETGGNAIIVTNEILPIYEAYIVNLFDNVLLCCDETHLFDIGTSFTNPIWHDGSTVPTYLSNQSEIVTIEATNLLGNQCHDTAIVAVSCLEIMNNDTIKIVQGQSVTLNVLSDTVLIEEFTIQSNKFFDFLFPTILGQEYLIEINGICIQSPSLSFDAAFNTTTFSQMPFPALVPYNTILPINNTYNPSTHKYDYQITGNGQPINFFLSDSDYSDNSGSFVVRIYRLPNPNWSTGATTSSITVSPENTTTYVVSNGRLGCRDSVTVCFFPVNTNNRIKPIDLKVYPNPTSEILNIEVQGNEETLETIEIIDIQGKIIRSDVFKQQQKVIIPLNGLPQGVYILRINGHTYRKVIKQ